MRRKLSAAAVSMLLGIVFIYYADGLWYMTAILCLSAICRFLGDEKQRRLYFRLLTAFLLLAASLCILPSSRKKQAY